MNYLIKRHPIRGLRTHIRILLVLNALTLLFAAYNSYEEQLPSLTIYLATVVAAVVAGSISSILFIAISKRDKKINLFFAIVAHLSTLTGTVIYLYYALNGKADSLHSAAHMHVIVFPISQGFLTVCGLALATLLSGIGKLITTNKGKTWATKTSQMPVLPNRVDVESVAHSLAIRLSYLFVLSATLCTIDGIFIEIEETP